MASIIQFFVFIPLLGLIISLFISDKKETVLSWVAFLTVGINLLSLLIFITFWLLNQYPVLNLKEVDIFKSKEYEFLLDLYFDKITVVYLLVGSFITFLITIYSRYYLHRESGYKRFFNTILFFYLGYSIAILSGNFETLFIGWEILGICSFLLISFYRDRYLPVKNAIKVFSVYRVGDVGLILAMWASHHLWHENITFLKLNNFELVHEHLLSHSYTGVFISIMILVAAAAKSAQLPFSSWLPRAMEGPTPSSAIFYGSLSVHLGVFLLLRTHPFWEHQISVRVLIALLGLSTSIIASLIARVQSSVKSQIAYASVAQIGIIFIEMALGFEKFALFHFAGNAFFRTYQLLVSPSVVSYMIREQFYNFVPHQHTFEDSLPKKIEYSIFQLSLKEWNLELFMNYMVWKPLKDVGRKLDFLTVNRLLFLFIPAYIIGLVFLFMSDSSVNQHHKYLPALFAFIGLLMIIKSYSERKSPLMSWLLLIMNHLWIALAISFNEKFEFRESVFYLSGVIISGVMGYLCLKRLKKLEQSVDLNQFSGHAFEHPKLALLFLLACLGLAGFPITPTFIGLDLVFGHIHQNQYILAISISLSFILSGISLIRLYSRIFLGPHLKTYHEVAFRSS